MEFNSRFIRSCQLGTDTSHGLHQTLNNNSARSSGDTIHCIMVILTWTDNLYSLVSRRFFESVSSTAIKRRCNRPDGRSCITKAQDYKERGKIHVSINILAGSLCALSYRPLLHKHSLMPSQQQICFIRSNLVHSQNKCNRYYSQGNGPIRHVETCPDFFFHCKSTHNKIHCQNFSC
jgi:hypothetical protein